MKRWLWFLAAILISTAGYFTIRYGLRPKPIPVLNATAFEEPGQIGAVVYRRLRQEIRAERVIVLGLEPGVAYGEDLWSGFLKTAWADQVHTGTLFVNSRLKPPVELASTIQVVPFTDAMVTSGELLNGIKTALEADHQIMVIAPPLMASHLQENSLSRQLDEAVRHPVLSLSLLDLNVDATTLTGLQAQCVLPLVDNPGLKRIECAEARVGKMLLKKRLQTAKYWAVMERHGLKEYLIFVDKNH